jgi:hypothetical protein
LIDKGLLDGSSNESGSSGDAVNHSF